MTTNSMRGLGAALLLLAAFASHADTAPSAAADESSRPDVREHMEWDDDPGWPGDEAQHDEHGRHDRHGHDMINIGHDSVLASDQKARSVVSILGNTRSLGTVGHDAVAVLGDTYVDGKVGGSAVAVGGSIELGPHADIEGEVVSILGSVRRDPAAIVRGDVNDILGGGIGDMSWLQSWTHHCLLYLRPLALAPGLGWAWGLALGLLAFYAAVAVVFRGTVERCVQTLEARPGHAVLTALISMLLTPVLIAVLCVTVIGIAAVPIAAAALLGVALFGKVVMLAWVGTRMTGRLAAGPLRHPAAAVLIGGALVTACYLVPVLGFLVYQLLGFLGFGVVIYSLILTVRAHQIANASGTANSAGMPGSSTARYAGATFVHEAAPPGGAPGTVDSTPSMGTQGNAGSAPSTDARGTADSAPSAGAQGTTEPPRPAAARWTAMQPDILSTLPRAGFWIRMTALLVDLVLTGVALNVLHDVFHFHLIVLAAYGAIMWKMRGATVGGLIFDLRVARTDGRPMEWETSIVRALGCFLSLAVVGLGFIWIAVDPANQAWHDKIAGTIVVRVPKGSAF